MRSYSRDLLISMARQWWCKIAPWCHPILPAIGTQETGEDEVRQQRVDSGVKTITMDRPIEWKDGGDGVARTSGVCLTAACLRLF
jgi:hypothetical protein